MGFASPTPRRRVGIVAILQESNTFLHARTTLDDFRRDLLVTGEGVRTAFGTAHHEVGGFFAGLESAGLEAVPLLAARALGYGGVLTGMHFFVEDELRALLGIPPEVFVAATITLGRPAGGHGPVRRRPLGELVFGDTWGEAPAWAVDPPGTQHTAAGPPRQDS